MMKTKKLVKKRKGKKKRRRQSRTETNNKGTKVIVRMAQTNMVEIPWRLLRVQTKKAVYTYAVNKNQRQPQGVE